MEKQITAVEWLCEKYHLKQDAEIVKQAKEMHEKQIKNAFQEGMEEMNLYETFRTLKNGLQYYYQTFKK
jgi:hypothetical protein